jgi:hypothetical protein
LAALGAVEPAAPLADEGEVGGDALADRALAVSTDLNEKQALSEMSAAGTPQTQVTLSSCRKPASPDDLAVLRLTIIA